MGYEKRVWDLGRIREVEERHTLRLPPPGKRAKKEKPTAEAVKRNNHRRMARQRRMQTEMYFDEYDCYLTLTYPKDRRPEDLEECKKDWRKLIGEVRKEFKKRGGELRWIRNCEKGTKGAYHIHAIVKELPKADRNGEPFRDRKGNPLPMVSTLKLIQQIWQKKMEKGKVIGEYLREDVAALAEYITKTPESSRDSGHEVLESHCSASRNMPLPEAEVVKYTHWKTFLRREVKVPKGWILDKGSVKESENPYNGFQRREYRLIKADAYGKNGARRC